MARRKKSTTNPLSENFTPEPLEGPAKEYQYAKDNIALASMASQEELFGSCGPGIGTPNVGTRGNVATSIPPLAQFSNIWEGAVNVYPYGNAGAYGGGYGSGGVNGYGGQIWIGYAIQLVQSAYTFIPKLTQTINLITELCVGKILLQGGTAQSRKFYENWLKKIDIDSIQNQYYLEDTRSGNVFFYRLNSTLNSTTVSQFNEAFGANIKASGKSLPIRYLLLNPAWIGVIASTTFLNPTYYKVLNGFELKALLDNPNDNDLLWLEKVPELKKFIEKYKEGKTPNASVLPQSIMLPLGPDSLVTIFQHKQDYEAMACPQFFGLMNLFNQKIELQKIDLNINRQILQANLLITMGDEKVGSPSPRQVANMTTLFNSNSISKVIVGDYTIKGNWLIPDVGNLFDPKKYQEVDKDIEEGLGNVLFGDSKYSGASVKADIFVERLNYRRNRFINEFLKPEMQRIADEFGFKDIPEPVYQPISIKEQATRERVFAQMAQLGLLTPEELNIALETNVLPTNYESILNQEKYKALRDKGLYVPLIGGPKEDASGTSGGRPGGSKSPQTSKKSKPAGNVGAEITKKYTVQSLKNTLLAATQLEKDAEKLAKNKFNVKKLTVHQKELVASLVEEVIKNENKSDWSTKLVDYMEFKESRNPEIAQAVLKINQDFEIGDNYAAAIFYHSAEEIK